MHVSLIASSVKIINKHDVLLCTDSSQPEWFCVATYVYVLGLSFANTAAAKSLSSTHDDRLVDCFHYVTVHIATDYLTFYGWTNGLTCFSTYGLILAGMNMVGRLWCLTT